MHLSASLLFLAVRVACTSTATPSAHTHILSLGRSNNSFTVSDHCIRKAPTKNEVGLSMKKLSLERFSHRPETLIEGLLGATDNLNNYVFVGYMGPSEYGTFGTLGCPLDVAIFRINVLHVGR